MRLSDAIAMGRCTIEKWAVADLRGCALGMAANAVGANKDYMSLEKQWPWLKQPRVACPYCGFHPLGTDKIVYLVGHVFDNHVYYKILGALTLDEMIDWVRSIEPPEPSESAAPEILTLAEELASIT